MPSDWCPPAGSGERRLSNSSDGSAGSGYSKALSTDSADFLATRPRNSKVIPGKPATNPLQFVKVGPCELYRSAQEQLRRAELVKKSKEVKKEEQEDWQSNLDNWKSSRRKAVEHIIERCVEVRRMETEPNPGARSKSKTFNEMLEERSGKRRRCPLALYTEEEATDLSDLGIGTSSTKSSLSEDCDTHSLASDGIDLDKNHSDVDNLSNCDMGARKLGSSANEYDTCTTTTISSPEPEEYTYEGAIEGYKSRISQNHGNSNYKAFENNNFDKGKSPEKVSNGDMNRIRSTLNNKIDEKVTSFQDNKVSDTKNNNPKKDLPKVDISKRREQFERENSVETQLNKPRLHDITSKKSIKERLSSLEKRNEEAQVQQKSSVDISKIPPVVVPLKQRLSCLEKVISTSSDVDKQTKVSNGDLSNTKSLKERLTGLKSQTSEEEIKIMKTEVKTVSMSIKERLSCLDAARNKEVPKISVEEELNNNEDEETKETIESEPQELHNDNSLKLSLTGIESQMQSFCRSLDSLDINGQSSPNSFDRVQSLEDFDCAEMQNNTSPSDIETEDSGIHTAHDSCVPVDELIDYMHTETQEEEPLVNISKYNASLDEVISSQEPIVEELSEPSQNQTDVDLIGLEEIDDQEISKTEDTDSASNYLQALSQPNDDLSCTEEITEIQMDKDDEDTLKSLEQDISVIDALELAFQEIDSEDSVMDKTDSENESPTVSEVVEAKENEFKKQNVMIDNAITEKHTEVIKGNAMPLYENIDIFYENGGVVDAATFPLDLPPNVLEPPKEKPPPPPTEDNDELLGNGNFRSTNSTRRIKKEIRNKRTSFLGIEGQVDDSYLDMDLKLAPRPDITSFLQEETKIEKLLYKKTLSHDMDSKLRESRDSGVDLDRGPSAEAWYNRQNSSPETSNPHSRQNSEPYTHITVTSDEEETIKKQNLDQHFNTVSTKLQHLQTSEVSAEQTKIDSLDKKLQEQQDCVQSNADMLDGLIHDAHTKEVLRFERELLQLEQEELRRQRENLLLRESQTRRKQKSIQDVTIISNAEKPLVNQRHKPSIQNYRHSMPNLLINPDIMVASEPTVAYMPEAQLKRQPFVSEEHMHRQFGMEESRKILSYSVDDEMKPAYSAVEAVRRPLMTESQVLARPPQPVLPAKPRSRESLEREITMRSSRIPSAVEYVNVDRTTVQLRPKSIINGQVPGGNVPRPVTVPANSMAGGNIPAPSGNVPAASSNGQYHHMSRHTLQVLSAAPTPKLISSNDWLQTRQARKPPAGYNYNQHWLIQEAEQRRIEEQRNKLRTKPQPNQRHSYHQEQSVQNTPPLMQNLSASHQHLPQELYTNGTAEVTAPARDSDKILSVSGRKKCSHCGEELGRGAAMIIESLSLCYHVWCFTCAVCGARLGDGRAGADVRVRGRRLHCHHCYSSDDGRKFSCV